MQNVGEFLSILFEIAATCHKIVEKMLHHDVGALGADAWFLRNDIRSLDDYFGADGIIGTHCAHLHFADSDNRREGLATEAHGVESEQIVGLADFRSGVTFESQTGVGDRHAASVVDNLDESLAGIPENNLDVVRSGVDGIFDKLLDD